MDGHGANRVAFLNEETDASVSMETAQVVQQKYYVSSLFNITTTQHNTTNVGRIMLLHFYLTTILIA
jgi:hypothetical protein